MTWKSAFPNAAMKTLLGLLLVALVCQSGEGQKGLFNPQPWGMPQHAQPWGMPQLRQRMNLENGICSRPLVVTVCVEGSMARGRSEFRHLMEFVGRVVSSLNNLQPRQLAMAINYCSYIKDWTPWTSSQQAFVSSLEALQWAYHFRPSPVGPYGGGYPDTGLGYGSFSPLQPNAGQCLERASQALAQVPPYYQRLILHVTSGRSSNPLLTMQHAQAAMYEGAEIFGITVKSLGLSEELRVSVSGFPYLMQVNSLASLSRRHVDQVIENVCRVERRPARTNRPEIQTGTASVGDGGVVDAGNGGVAGDEGTSGGIGGVGIDNGGSDGEGAGTDGVGGVDTSNGGMDAGDGGLGTGNGGVVVGTGNSGIGGANGAGTGAGGVLDGTGSGGISGSGGVLGGTGSGGVGDSGGVLGGTGSGGVGGSGGVLGGTGSGGVGGSGGVLGGTGSGGISSSGGVLGGTGSGGVGDSGGVLGGTGSGGVGGSGGVLGGTGSGGVGDSGGVLGGTGSGGVSGSGGVLGGTGSGGVGGSGGVLGGAGSGGVGGGIGAGNGGLGGVGGSGGIGGGVGGGIGGGAGNGGLGGVGGSGGIGGGAGNGGLGGVGGSGGIGGGVGGGIGGGAGNGGLGGAGGLGGGTGGGAGNGGIGGVGGIGGGAANMGLGGAGGLGTGNNAGGAGGGAGGAGAGNGNNNNNNNNNNNGGIFQFTNGGQALCVPVGFISNPFLRQLYLAGRRPCPIVTMRPLPTIAVSGCVDLSNAENELARQVLLLANYPRPACPEVAAPTAAAIATTATAEAATTTISIITTEDLSTSTAAETTQASTTSIPELTTTGPSTTACVDVSIFPEDERAGAVIFLSIYGIIACPITNTTRDNSTVSCFDISGFPEDQRPIIIEIIRPLLPCNETVTTVAPGAPADPLCFNVSLVAEYEQGIAFEFLAHRSLVPCPNSLNTTTASTAETPSTTTASSACIDVSIFPPDERSGAVIFLSIYGIQTCPLTNSSSESGRSNTTGCFDISGFPEEQRAIIIEIIKPNLPCNDTLESSSSTSSSTTRNYTVPCANISSVNGPERDMVMVFITSQGILPCDVSSEASCVNISIYAKPEDRSKAIEFFNLYNITICPEVTTPNATSTAPTQTDQPLCIDVSIFPVNEQQGAVVFLSLFGIQPCHLTNSGSGDEGSGSENCIDISRFSEEQKAVIIEIIKPATPCNDTENSSPASSSSGSASRDLCVNITLVEDSRRQMVIDFIASHNLTACKVISETADTPPASPPNTNCVDLSIYSTPEDRARAIAFFELYNITICPETSVSSTTNAPEAATTPSVSPSLPCIDVSVFPVNEQPGAVVFLSLYGIQACPLTNSSSGAGGENSTDCVDISGFTDEQKAVIIEIIKPSVPCNKTLASTVATSGVDTTGAPCVNLSSVDNLNQQMANGFLMSCGLLPCEGSSYTIGTGCVDVSVYTNPDDRTRAIEFFQLYNITMCFETVTANAMTTNSPMNDQPLCIDVSIFPVNEQQGAIVFLSLYGIQACPLTNTDSGGGETGSENCIDISRFLEEQKAVIIEIIKPATPCNDTENSSPASSSSGSASSDLCVNITLIEDSRRQMVIDFIASHNLTACEVSSETADTPPASPPNTNCVDLSIYSTPEDRARAIAFFDLYNITICPEANVSSTVNASAVTTTPSVSPSLPCIDVSVFPVNEQPGAIVFLSLYGIQACPLTNSSSGAGGENSTDCVDISGFTDEQKAVIIEIIKPSVPCNNNLASTVATRGVDTTGTPCVNLSSVDNLNQQMANGFLMSRGLLPCEGSSYTIGTGCVDVSVYTNPDDRARAIEFFQLYNITMCFETVTANAMTTNSPMNDQPLCIDVSIFPVNEQQGAIVFLSLFGIQACPLTNTDSGGGGTGSENCIDISRYSEEQKAVIIEIIKPATPCNDTENSSPARSSSGSASRDLCANITLVEDSRRQMVIDFIASHNLTACEVSSETADTPPASPPNTNCVDLSIYSTPEDRARAIAFFELYNITICPEANVSSTTNAPEAATTPSVSAPLPCLDVSVFPVNEQPGAVVFLSLYGIQTCPLTNSSSGTGGENSTDCVDISGFTDEQKAVIIEIIKQSVPCNNTLASTVATPGVDTTGAPCVNLSSVDNLNQQMANGVLMSRGLLPCEASSYTTGTGCVDVSVYTNPEDRTRAIEFFQLYNITMCFETVTANAMTTNSPMNDQPLCIDVSIFPVNEQQGAIVFLSLFGIQACPLTNTDSGGGGTGSENCIDISRFSEEQKAVIIEIIKPATPCNDTENSSPASSSSGSASRDLCVNITLVEDSRRQMVIDFIASHNLTACEVSSETADTPPASPPNTNCVDLSIYSTPEDRARAIAFYELYNITICPEANVSSTTNAPEAATTPSVSAPLPCLDVSVFPVNEQPGAVVFLSLYGIQACPLTNSSSGAGGENSTDCVDISGFTDEQKAVIIEIIKPCNNTLASTVATPGVDTTGAPCVNLSSVDNLNQQMANGFLMSRGLLPCEGSSYTTGTGCVDVSVYTNPDDRTKAIEFFQLYNITMCFETVTANTMTTSSPVTAQTLCIDVSIFPVNEQTGAVVFLSLYGIQACPLTNSGSGAGDANKTDCIDISGFTDEQKAIIVEIIKPRSPCNESTGLIDTVTGKTGTSQFSCFNLSSLAEPEKKLVTSFMMAHGLSPCEASESTTTGPSRPTINITTQGCVDVSGYANSEERDNAIAFFRLYNISICSNSIVSPTVTSVPDSGGSGGTTSECVDVSQYSDPVERANAIQFLNLYNINICPETSVTLKAKQTLTTGSPALQDNSAGITACVDVSIFPQQEQPGAVLFLSIYGILACPITDSGPGSTNSIQCIDVSEFSQEQKLIIIDIVKPVPPCNGTESEEPSRSTDGSGTSSTGTIPSARACVNISSIVDSETDTVLQFMQLHGLQACSSPLATISTATVKPTSECIDVSGYTDLEERARAISFFELYNYTICPDPTSSTTESVTTARSSVTASESSGGNADSSGITFGTEPCLDVSIFPENERSNAVVFLSIYGILACPLTNSTSSDSNCIDLSGFTDDRRAVIEELIKPALPCNEISSETVADTGNLQDTSFTGDNPNFNGGSSQTQTKSVTLGPDDTPVSTTGRPCVNISSYEEQERAAAIEFFGQYGISPCENAVTTAASTTARNCVDLTGVVPALREFVLALNAPLRPCDEAEVAVAIDTSDAGTNTISAGANTVSASIGEDTASAALLSSAAATLCLDCRGPDGLCYNPDPGSCSNFLQCSRATTTTTASVTWTHNVLPCQSGTFWSQESLTCVHPEDSSCLRQTCLANQESKIQFQPNCAQFLTCDTSGIISRQCCPTGQVFLGGSCQAGVNSGCSDLCI